MKQQPATSQEGVMAPGKRKRRASYGKPVTRKAETFHVGLQDHDPNEDYWLQALGKRYTLVPHTDETRERARKENHSLYSIDDQRLTHFTKEAVDLPQHQVTRVQIRKTLKAEGLINGKSGMILAAIYVPQLTPENSDGLFKNTPPPPPPPPVVDYVSTAQALVFHHMDLINNDPSLTSIIYSYMDVHTNEAVYNLIEQAAELMKEMGEPTTGTSGWAQLVQTTEQYNDQNYYLTQPRSDVQDKLGPAMTQMMIYTKNDTRLQGQKWTLQQGVSVQDETPVNAPAPEKVKVATIERVKLQGDNWNAVLKNTNTSNGLESSITVTGENKIQITMTNYYLRWLGAYICFYDAENAVSSNPVPMSVPDWTIDNGGIVSDIASALGIEYDNLRFMGWMSPVDTVFAVPISADPGILTVNVTFPDGAVKAEIFGCGLGTGANLYPKSLVLGGVFTGLNNLGIPAFMLGLGVAAQTYKPLYDIMSDPTFIKVVVGLGATYFAGDFIYQGAVNKKMDWSTFSTMAQILFNQGANKALLWVEEQIVEGEIEDEIPFAGWIMLSINIATGIAQIAETIVEVATSPWMIENSISTSITSTITLYPDPRHKAFPQIPAGSKGTYVTKIVYQDNTPSRTITQDVPSGTPLTLTTQFTNLLGGSIKFEVDFYVDSWLAGKATTGFMDNNEDNTSEVSMYLVELPVPITSTTVFEHSAILTYQNNAYQWMDTGTAPTATIKSRNNSNTGNYISDWVGLTLSQRYGMVGFAWKAAGTGLKDCSSGTGDIQLNVFQNINIPGDPMNNVKFPGCGFTSEAQLIYDSFPPKFKMNNGQWVIDPNTGQPEAADDDNPLGDYYVDPTLATIDPDNGGGYHLRKVDLSNNSPFNTSSGQLSYGRFPYFPDSFALHPSGHVVAINTENSKVMILQLAPEGAANNALPLAQTFAGKALNLNDSNGREGLLFAPIAVACTYDGTILILDQVFSADATVSRIQAFDLNGNPVNYFADSSGNANVSPFLTLPNNVTYLDLAAVGDNKLTYMFVLYYQNDGSAVSDYMVTVYQAGTTAGKQPLVVTNKSIPAAKVTVDMWHTMYTLNYAMVTDGKGNVAGPTGTGTGPGGRTVASVSEWLPSVPTSLKDKK